jgi:Putative peptidoglycan binding domain
MKRALIPCLTLFLLTAHGAQAADDGGRFAIKGAGLMTCKQYTAARTQKLPVVYSLLGWLDGYISAQNELSPDTFDVAAWESTDLFSRILDSHCGDHPDDQIFSVVRSIVTEIRARRLMKESPLIPARNGNDVVVLYAETLRRAQVELAKLALFDGEADGRFGDQTIRALKLFQSKNGIRATGLPDQVTLWRLFRPSSSQ